MTIVVDKDLRARFGTARDQDPRPTCMAFAASDAHAAARSEWRFLSAEWVYYHALKHDNGKLHEGLTVEAALTALRLDGQPEEAAWPYITSLFIDQNNWAPPTASPIFRRNSDTQIDSVDKIISCLDADKHVLFTMSVSSAFFNPDPGGIIANPEPIEPDRVHALVAVGHGHRNQDKFILVRNSWGETWANGGYGWVCTKYLAPRLLRTATMAEEL